MESIKLRAIATSDGDWVYGNFIHSKRFKGCGNEYRIHNKETGLESDILPYTLCRYIAIKNGVEFYEHDIIDDITSIRWSDKEASFEFYNTRTGESLTENGYINWYEFMETPNKWNKVYGNIFDNEDLASGRRKII